MPENPNIPLVSRTQDETRNRAFDTRRDTDEFVTPSISLYDIDYAILHHLNERIQIEVEENGKKIKVETIFANGERWAQIKRFGYLRDADSTTITPIIILKRNVLAKDERVPKLDIPQHIRANSLFYYPAQQHNNQHDFIDQLENTKKSQEYYVSVIPDHVKVSYTLYIWTTFQEQMNKVVQQLIPQNRLPWGDVFQFTTMIGEFTFDDINGSGEDRLIRANTTLDVDGMLQDEFVARESTVQKAFTTKRVVFKNEREQYDIIADYMPRVIKPAPGRIPRTGFK